MNIRRYDHLASRTVRFSYMVSGEGAFPLAMLHFDGAHPATPMDAKNIESSLIAPQPGRKVIELITVRDEKWTPMQSRWRRHGWRVE